jgi:hypothetical protein
MSESKSDDKPMCWCGGDLDEEDVENWEEACRKDGFYRKKDGSPECQFCLPRYWDPVEAISKWGFDDGNRRRMTDHLAEALGECGGRRGSLVAGYGVKTFQIGMHNQVIRRIYGDMREDDRNQDADSEDDESRDNELLWDYNQAHAAARGNEEVMFAGMPLHIRYVMLKARHDDLVDLASDHEVPQEDLDRSKLELDAVEAEMAAARMVTLHLGQTAEEAVAAEGKTP